MPQAKQHVPLRAALVAGAALLIIAAVAVGLAFRANSGRQQRIAQLTSENRQLKASIADLSRRAAREITPPEGAGEPAEREKPRKPSAQETEKPEHAQVMKSLQEMLASSNASISRLEARTMELDEQRQKLTLENKRISASEADLRDSLASANRTISALQQEVKGKNDRLLQLDLEYNKLRESSAGDQQQLAKTSQLSQELQEIHRRREVYLNNIIRRYRELTEQYRFLASRDREGAAGAGTDLSRIQNTVSLAEEDLRQLNTLNAQAMQIQRKLSGK